MEEVSYFMVGVLNTVAVELEYGVERRGSGCSCLSGERE